MTVSSDWRFPEWKLRRWVVCSCGWVEGLTALKEPDIFEVLYAHAPESFPLCSECHKPMTVTDFRSGCPLCQECQNGPIEEMR